jgi:alkylhydroperoxidase family enzyme
MLAGPDTAGFDDRLKPILRFARRLTEAPASVTDADAQVVFDAGWYEKALHDAILVVCCFNFMNRLLEGHGAHGNEALFKERGPMLKKYGYLPLIRLLPLP